MPRKVVRAMILLLAMRSSSYVVKRAYHVPSLLCLQVYAGMFDLSGMMLDTEIFSVLKQSA